MSRMVLGIIGVLMALMGVLALIPSWRWMDQPAWYSWLWIIIGIIVLIIAISDSKE